MNEYTSTVLELGIGFIALFTFTKVIGKVQLSQITPFDFISALILGELLGNAVYDQEVSIWRVLFATVIWGVLVFSVTLLTQKIKSLRKTLEGEPSIVIRKGLLQYEVMRKNKLDINQLQGMARQQGCFSLRDVEYAILETNGTISVLKTVESATPTRKDLSLPKKEVLLPVTLILDGELVADNLEEAQRSETWLQQQMARQGVHSYKDVLYAEWNRQAEDPVYIQTYS